MEEEPALLFALFSAAADWIEWEGDYLFEGDAREISVLADLGRFRKFAREYRPFRQRQSAEHGLNVRARLRADDALVDALQDETGEELEHLALAHQTPELGVPRSAVSKIAMFCRPEVFPPWDRFARMGVTGLIGGRADGSFPSYDAYVAAFRIVWAGEVGESIRNLVASTGWPIPNSAAFPMRVLDFHLMRLGGWRGQ